ncbi:MAG: MBL fold metallo-hydrolase, partial [Bacteroidota bacterium]|nr:MBL fold metallo-hydrolase [Bacteroidota bacterium]
LECGQYNEAWHDIHMMPEETAQAALDVNAKAVLPVHWAKFCISLHAWNDPINRITKKGAELNVNIITPMIGEPIVIGGTHQNKRWWEMI